MYYLVNNLLLISLTTTFPNGITKYMKKTIYFSLFIIIFSSSVNAEKIKLYCKNTNSQYHHVEHKLVIDISHNSLTFSRRFPGNSNWITNIYKINFIDEEYIFASSTDLIIKGAGAIGVNRVTLEYKIVGVSKSSTDGKNWRLGIDEQEGKCNVGI